MKMLNEMEMNLVNGGIINYIPPTPKLRAEEEERKRHQKWLEWVNQEKQKMQGIADIRIRAAEAALKAAMRLDRAEMEIKEAMKASFESLALD